MSARAALVLAAGLGLAGPAEACRLAMTIGMDVSASIDENEHALQRQGLVTALLDVEVVDAFLAEPEPVALHIFEWSGRARQTVIQDWTLIAAAGDLEAVAKVLERVPRANREFPTALGQALIFASRALEAVECEARMVNISGDGENNDGIQPQVVLREYPFDEVVVNGLVVGGNVARLARYFEQHVVHGPGAFVEVAQDFENFAAAMRRKLIRELGPVAQAGMLLR